MLNEPLLPFLKAILVTHMIQKPSLTYGTQLQNMPSYHWILKKSDYCFSSSLSEFIYNTRRIDEVGD